MKKIFFILLLLLSITFVKADIKNGEFTTHNTITNTDIIDNYYYSDDYFKKSSYIKNEHLRTFSLALIISSDQLSIMKDIGLSNVKTYENDKNNINTIGTTIGYKKMDNYNLIIVSIKNDKKEEWASNFLLGSSGNAKGFNEATILAVDRIRSYIKDNNLKNNKILISGYSRAGGITNLVGIYINEHLDEFETKDTNLFVYTFEAPNSSSSTKIYKNIHNVINHNDLVTYIYPVGMGLNLNGIEENITTSSKKIMSKYFNLGVQDKNEIDERKFLEEFFTFLSDNVSREEYASIESDISDLVLLYESNKKEFENIKEFFTGAFNNYLYDENGNFNTSNGLNFLTLLNTKNEKEAKLSLDNIKRYLNSYEENDNYLEIENKIINIYLKLQKAFYNDYNKEFKGKQYPLYYVLTFVNNFNNLVVEHYTDTIWNSVKNKDSYYKLGPGKEYKKDQPEAFAIIGLIGIIIVSVVTLIKIKKNNK